MPTTKLSSKHQIVAPKAVREMMKLKAGMSVALYPLDENQVVGIGKRGTPGRYGRLGHD